MSNAGSLVVSLLEMAGKKTGALSLNEKGRHQKRHREMGRHQQTRL